MCFHQSGVFLFSGKHHNFSNLDLLWTCIRRWRVLTDRITTFKEKRRDKNLLESFNLGTDQRTIRKVMGGRGIFEPQELFFVIKFLV